MNEPHTIEIVIDKDGQIKSEVHGVSGPNCAKLTEWLNGLGNVTEDRHKPEFYQTTADQQTTGY